MNATSSIIETARSAEIETTAKAVSTSIWKANTATAKITASNAVTAMEIQFGRKALIGWSISLDAELTRGCSDEALSLTMLKA